MCLHSRSGVTQDHTQSAFSSTWQQVSLLGGVANAAEVFATVPAGQVNVSFANRVETLVSVHVDCMAFSAADEDLRQRAFHSSREGRIHLPKVSCMTSLHVVACSSTLQNLVAYQAAQLSTRGPQCSVGFIIQRASRTTPALPAIICGICEAVLACRLRRHLTDNEHVCIVSRSAPAYMLE
jgi:hypothetical protein